MKQTMAREISYASTAKSRRGRAIIRTVENLTGRIGLLKRASGIAERPEQGADFWRALVDRYDLSLNVMRGSLETIPTQGPLILISNHPYGILDGLMMGYILSALRGDFRIIAHRVFRRAEALNRVILPIYFDETPEALAQNIQTRAEALRYLGQGGAIGIFPGGTVSTAARPFGQPLDPVWRNFTARMIAKSDATVVPVFFEGHNSRLFQIASHLNYTLRMALLIKEFRARIDEPVGIAIGEPIPRAEIEARKSDAKALMDFLRKSTYDLSPKPLATHCYGYEFEEKYRA
jgi:putative hemolysin